jgi:hypothetical protein
VNSLAVLSSRSKRLKPGFYLLDDGARGNCSTPACAASCRSLLRCLQRFTAAVVQWIIHEAIGSSPWRRLAERAGVKCSVRIAVLRVEIEVASTSRQVGEAISVFPVPIGACVTRREQVVGDLFLQESRPRQQPLPLPPRARTFPRGPRGTRDRRLGISRRGRMDGKRIIVIRRASGQQQQTGEREGGGKNPSIHGGI